MKRLTRRRFMVGASAGIGVAAAGALAAAPQLERALGPRAGTAAAALRTGRLPAQTIVLQVRDAATSEVSLMWSTREIVYRDPELLKSLVAKLQAQGVG